MTEDALTSYDIRKFYLSILYVIRRIDDVPGIYFLNNHQEHHPMQKHILSTCLAISLIANTSHAVEPDRTITGTGSSSNTSEMSDGQAAAVVGGLLLLGGIMSLHSQSVVKAEETATQQATKTIELKQGHSYLWSTGSDDNNPLIEYIESCNPAKQFTVKAKIANGIADSSDYYMSRTESEGCTRTYDSRQKAVQEYAGNPWNLNEASYQKEQAERKAAEARAVEGAAKMIGGIGKWLFGSGSGGTGSSGSSNYDSNSAPALNNNSGNSVTATSVEQYNTNANGDVTYVVRCSDSSTSYISQEPKSGWWAWGTTVFTMSDFRSNTKGMSSSAVADKACNSN
jgi:hypothetical protein